MSGSAWDRCFLGKHNILHIKTNKVGSFKNQPFVYSHLSPTNYQVRYTTGAVVTTGAGATTVVVLYTGVEYTGVV